ncbi:hypothetical protein JCGZ_15018 [Jatropha curcas]|uniref:Uncharacterized protein n=1 Tax=Jatropha curcas TaxID=180498 RepID=A0A067LD52_JATCU|nr:uncharacterized protein LOC105643395 [Jatropha curcas]KDP45153.1 hypothetical protein JCGZ_15018 [Jatropha curcas]
MEGPAKMGMLEIFMRNHQQSLKSLFLRKRLSDSSEDGSPGISPRPIPQLSPLANSVVTRCSRILGVPTHELQHHFDIELPESVKQLFSYARNFLEFCSYQALNWVTRRPDYLSDKEFRRLTYDMMLAWESPSIELESNPQLNETASPCYPQEEDEDGVSLFYSSSTNMAVQVDDTKTVGREAFARIAPACAVVADVMTVHNLFDALTSTSGERLHFLIYDKYLHNLDKIIRGAKSTPGLLISNLQLAEGEIILDVDGTVPTQPILQHIGISAWPGRLTLTNFALYFESLGVGIYDKAVRYDLATDMKQVIKPELTGPLGARLFDKAVMYKSIATAEPVYFEFPEFKGNSRRDYWLDISIEILHAYKFIRKNNFKETQQLEVLARAILGIFRSRAIREAFHFFSSHYKTVLAFKLAESLPKGDKILETLSSRLALLNVTASPRSVNGFANAKQQPMLSPVALLTLRRLGLMLQKETNIDGEAIEIGDLCVGETNPLEIAVKKSVSDIGRAEAAQATVDKVKVEGIDTNVAVMKELMFPVIEFVSCLQRLACWEDPFKSMVLLVVGCYVILRGWIKFILPSIFICSAVFMFFQRHFNKKEPLEAFRVRAPPNKNAVEQLLTLQEAVTHVEALIQTGNIILLKIRALLFAVLPQATDRIALLLVFISVTVALVPSRYLILMIFLEAFTREMPYRKESSDRWRRRLREWWIRIPAAPVQLLKLDENKKKK